MVKYIEVCEAIKRDIESGVYTFGGLIPTENDLSAKYGVSRIVVRMAVDKLVKLGFVEKKAGFGTKVCVDLSEKKGSKAIGVIFCFLASSFGAPILLSIESEARKKGYSLIFKNSDNSPERERECLRELFDFGVAGVIMQPVHNETASDGLLPFAEKKIPVVLIDRDLKNMNFSFVGTDSILETRNSVHRLFSLGFRSLGLVSQDILSATSLSERVKGFRLAHEKAGIPFSPAQILSNICSIASYSAANYQTDKRNIGAFLLQGAYDCILATELGVSQIISDVISEDERFKSLALATFDRSETPLKYGRFYILQNQNEMGEKAFAMLSRQIREGSLCVKQFVATEFVVL